MVLLDPKWSLKWWEWGLGLDWGQAGGCGDISPRHRPSTPSTGTALPPAATRLLRDTKQAQPPLAGRSKPMHDIFCSPASSLNV